MLNQVKKHNGNMTFMLCLFHDVMCSILITFAIFHFICIEVFLIGVCKYLLTHEITKLKKIYSNKRSDS